MEVRKKMKSNSFKEYIQPTVVLVAICLVITFALNIYFFFLQKLSFLFLG